MTEYGLDVTADQIVHWLKDDLAAGRRQPLEIRATREYISEPVANLEEAGLSEDAEVDSLTTVGILEAKLFGVEDSWVLRVRVEDEVGLHVPEDESVPDFPEEIDLDTFDADFVAPDRGTAYVTLYADTPQAKKAFDRVFAELIVDRHSR
jgi:hypothetical protein